MPRVVSHTEVAAVADGNTLTVEPDTIVTPLAAAEARSRGITIARLNDAGHSPALIRQVTRQVVAKMGDASPEVLEAVIGEVVRAVASGDASRDLIGEGNGATRVAFPEAVRPSVVSEANESEEVPSPWRGPRGMPATIEVAPGLDYCAACLEQDRARSRHRAVLTTTGRNQKGIVARITAKIAELAGDILDISQTLVGDYFTMIIVIDIASLAVPFADFKHALEAEVKSMGLQTMIMHEDVVNSLQRV